MSLQSDTEMLSVSAVEEYATQNHMIVDATYELFHRHQIFEKIILLIAICAGKAVNRDSINTKVFEEERVGFGEEKLSPESFSSPSPMLLSPFSS